MKTRDSDTHRTSRLPRFLLWILLCIAAIAILTYVISRPQTEASNPPSHHYELANDESTQHDALAETSVNRERLRQLVQKSNISIDTASLNAIIQQNPDVVFGVSIKDLDTGTVHDYGHSGAMTAASVTKVLTATYYLHLVELGQRSLSTTMANGQTAQYNIEQMIVVSNNEAWQVLNENLGYTQMQSYAQSIGLTSYDYTDNTISAHHTTQLLGDLYERKLIDESNTQLLLSYMERANYRDLIIPAVPPEDTVYHKAGEYLASLNDAAIITNATQTIVLSIYTESTQHYDKPYIAGLMQQITVPTIQTFHLN
jgi:beta-lactamase class A